MQACTIQMIRLLLYYYTVSTQYYDRFLNRYDGHINTFSEEWDWR